MLSEEFYRLPDLQPAPSARMFVLGGVGASFPRQLGIASNGCEPGCEKRETGDGTDPVRGWRGRRVVAGSGGQRACGRIGNGLVTSALDRIAAAGARALAVTRPGVCPPRSPSVSARAALRQSARS